MPRAARTPTALSIAGSDSGGGAGVQADLKAFARCGVHGLTAITAITAQNTLGVSAVHVIPPELILAQVRAVAGDIGVDAVKVGMLGTRETLLAVVQALDELPPHTPVVVDPVMVSESGARLLDDDARDAVVRELLPRATVVTPNVPEALALTGADPDDAATDRDERPNGHAAAESAWAEALVQRVRALGAPIAVLTGGHRDHVVDVYCDERQIVLIAGERHPDGAAHGSGCTHSSVLAAQLALGRTPLEAARQARQLAGEAVGRGLRDVGRGAGPVDVLGLSDLRSGRAYG